MPIINRIDCRLGGYLHYFNEKSALIATVFHAILQDPDDCGLHLIDPGSAVSVDEFCDFVEYFQNEGYAFVSPETLHDPGSDKRILVTFDDGYYNNLAVVPVLAKNRIPAIFFVSTDHICHRKGFWWDILYRERMREGKSRRAIAVEQMSLKNSSSAKIEAYLASLFGTDALQPVGDIDRPMTWPELEGLAARRNVFIGNHTHTHAILTNCSGSEGLHEIKIAQEYLRAHIGFAPSSIAYPNGNYNPEIIEYSRKCGISLGFSMDRKKNFLPLNESSDIMMKLGRFPITGRCDITRQCRAIRLDMSVGKFCDRFARSISHW